jgi:imidazolonepropionase-like amidohydrolase
MGKTLTLLLLLSLPVAGFWRQAQNKPQVKTLVLNRVTMIDATGAEAKPETTVVITGDRITAIGKSAEVKIPKDAQVIEAAGKFLIPGLWDMHTHVASQDFLALFIANGVTGVRDMGGVWETLSLWRKWINEGRLIGPRIVAAGPIVDGPKPIWPFSVAVADERQARQAVASLKQRGVDFIKVYSLLPRSAYFALADEAKKQGLSFAGHVPLSVTAAEAVAAGQKSIEHLDMILLGCSGREEEIGKEYQDSMKNPDVTAAVLGVMRARAQSIADSYNEEKAQELFAQMSKNGVRLCPTLTAQRAVTMLGDPAFTNDSRTRYIPAFIKTGWDPKSDFRLKSLTSEEIARARESFQGILDLVGAIRRANVELLAGTDTANPYCFPGFSLHDELALLVKAGLTPMEALQTATRNSANFLGLLNSHGTIEQGKIADLVLLDANPLSEIANTQKINAVVTGGKLLDKAALQTMLAQAEAAAKRQ